VLGLLAGLEHLLERVQQGQQRRVAAALAHRPAQLAQVLDAPTPGHVQVLGQVARTLLRVGEQLPQGETAKRLLGHRDRARRRRAAAPGAAPAPATGCAATASPAPPRTWWSTPAPASNTCPASPGR